MMRRAKAIGAEIYGDFHKFPEGKWRLERALRQPFSGDLATSAACVLIQAAAHQMAMGPPGENVPEALFSGMGARPPWDRKGPDRREPPDPELGFNPAGALAVELAGALSAHLARRVLKQAVEAAGELGAALPGSDLAGPLLQRLAAVRKDLSVYHTKPAAAELMAHLAVPPELEWGNPETAENFRFADYACGTGELLMAAYRRARELCRRAGTDPAGTHRRMIEENITAFDVLPASVAVAASNLALMEPGVPFRTTRALRLHVGPLPGRKLPRKVGLGSLDMLLPARFQEQGRRPIAAPGLPRGQGKKIRIQPGAQDLVVMNAPFSKYSNPARTDQNYRHPTGRGAPTSREEREEITRALREIRETTGGYQTSGMGFHFTAIAHRMVKRGGTVALILPVGAFEPEAREPGSKPHGWAGFRRRLAREYADVTVLSVAQYEEKDSSFSHDTTIAEVMLIARRTREGEKGGGETAFVNLRRTPGGREEAAAWARAILEARGRAEPGGAPVPLAAGTGEIGSMTMERACPDGGTAMAGMLDTGVARDAERLSRGIIGTAGEEPSIPMTRVGNLGGKGPTRDEVRRLLSEMGEGEFPVIEGHDCTRQRSLAARATRLLGPRDGMETAANRMFHKKGSRAHISNECRYNSQSTAACITDGPALGGRGWTSVKMVSEPIEKSVVTWTNTTMGLVGHWRASSHTQHGLGQMGESKLMEMRTLDVPALSPGQVQALERICDEMAGRPMLPANEAWRDQERQELDRQVLEDVLGLGPGATRAVAELRNRWCREPTVQGRKGARKSRRDDMENLDAMIKNEEGRGER